MTPLQVSAIVPPCHAHLIDRKFRQPPSTILNSQPRVRGRAHNIRSTTAALSNQPPFYILTHLRYAAWVYICYQSPSVAADDPGRPLSACAAYVWPATALFVLRNSQHWQCPQQTPTVTSSREGRTARLICGGRPRKSTAGRGLASRIVLHEFANTRVDIAIEVTDGVGCVLPDS